MAKTVRILGASVGVGVILAGGIVTWLHFRPKDNDNAVASSGGSVVLSTTATPTPSPDPKSLQVASPLDVGSGKLGSSSTQGVPVLGASDKAATSSSPAATPEPQDFEQYTKYQNNETALFGEIVPGTGVEVKAGNTLEVNYRGWLMDGKLFDESYTGGKAFIFKLGDHKVIEGWEQGLIGMKVGGKRRLIVPPKAGYGVEGKAPVPPNALMIFDVELVAVQ